MCLDDVGSLGHVGLHDVILDVLLCLLQDTLLGQCSLVVDSLVVEALAHGDECVAGGGVAQCLQHQSLALAALGDAQCTHEALTAMVDIAFLLAHQAHILGQCALISGLGSLEQGSSRLVVGALLQCFQSLGTLVLLPDALQFGHRCIGACGCQHGIEAGLVGCLLHLCTECLVLGISVL